MVFQVLNISKVCTDGTFVERVCILNSVHVQ